ncbi:MAG: dihydrofolate reductase [Clostridia bacterium]|nr:dihydrofolate reductase [Clostridia bacterium]
MKLIVAVSQNWGIGKNNDLLFNIPKDMKFFREITMGKTVILGRKNLESFPNAKPLPKRPNIILTRDKNFVCDGATVVHSIDELLAMDIDFADAFVIGGEEIYRQLLPYCDLCYVTKVKESVPADKFMVNLDELSEWKLTQESDEIEDNGHTLTFCTYERK